jgi:hypothetical protein
LLEGCPIVTSRTLLVVARPFGPSLDAEGVAAAIGEGLRAGRWEVDPLPIDAELADAGAVSLARSADFEARMRPARAVVIAEPRLDERTLAGTVAFEIATRARQGGVPAYAVTGENELDSFDARILDLQTILQARSHRSLTNAGLELAALLGPPAGQEERAQRRTRALAALGQLDSSVYPDGYLDQLRAEWLH